MGREGVEACSSACLPTCGSTVVGSSMNFMPNSPSLHATPQHQHGGMRVMRAERRPVVCAWLAVHSLVVVAPLDRVCQALVRLLHPLELQPTRPKQQQNNAVVITPSGTPYGSHRLAGDW